MSYDSWKLATPPEYYEEEVRDTTREPAWQGPMWNGCGACNYVRRSSETGRVWCAWCEKEYRAALVCLAHNLALAAALCAAFTQGWDEREHHDLYSSHGYRTDEAWRPGCRRRAL